jgi:rRNA maturation protein Nop10
MNDKRDAGGWMTVSALCPRCGVKQALASAPARCVECGTLLYAIAPARKDDRATQRLT